MPIVPTDQEKQGSVMNQKQAERRHREWIDTERRKEAWNLAENAHDALTRYRELYVDDWHPDGYVSLNLNDPSTRMAAFEDGSFEISFGPVPTPQDRPEDVPDELIVAIAEHAWRTIPMLSKTEDVVRRAIRLALSGWRPPEPDPIEALALEYAARYYDENMETMSLGRETFLDGGGLVPVISDAIKQAIQDGLKLGRDE